MTDIQVGQKWRHKKRGTLYEIVCTAAFIQCATDPHVESYEDEDWVAYHPVGLSPAVALHFRMKEEFLDGRFELVEDAV